MRSHLNDLAFIQHQDQVSNHHRLDAVSDNEGRAILHQLVQRIADGGSRKIHFRNIEAFKTLNERVFSSTADVESWNQSP